MAKHIEHERSVTKARMAERRREVARLYVVGNMNYADIAEQVGVSAQTVYTDMAYVVNMWLDEARALIGEKRAREAGEIRQLEAECARRYLETKKVSWIRMRLKLKERYAKMFALDIPQTVRSELELSVRPPDKLASKLAELSIQELRDVIEVASSDPQRLLEAGDGS